MEKVPRIVELPKFIDPRGSLTYIQHPQHIPFEIQRAFWTYDVPGGEVRGGHAYKTQVEFIIALSGSFDIVVLDEVGVCTKYSLNRSYYGLLIPSMTWRRMENFSTNSLALHLSSSLFDVDDYLRDYELFQNMKNEGLNSF